MKKEIKPQSPVPGAAEYYAGYDYENGKKPCVFMSFVENGETYTSIIEYAKTIESARKKSINWQQRENLAVLKNKPSDYPGRPGNHKSPFGIGS